MERELPRMSSSEEVAFKTCRRAWAFGYKCRYAPVVTNSKLSVGIGLHLALEQHYLDANWDEIHATISDWASARWAELEAAGISDNAEVRIEFIKNRDLVVEMAQGYRRWVAEEHLDLGWETVAVEKEIMMQVPDPDYPGDPFIVMPCKLDLLQRHEETDRLRIVDFKTAKFLTKDFTKYELAEQNGNYSLAVLSEYGERPDHFQYRECRKQAPTARSKPPYFQAIDIRLTPEELVERAHQYIATAKEAIDPDIAIYANPSACCGSWKNDWQGPCRKVSAGASLEDALSTSTGYAEKDPYERYTEEPK